MRRTGAWLGVCVALLMLCACASAPVTRFHSLLSADPTAVAATPARDVSWELLPVAIPAQVDRPQMVLRLADGSLALLEHDRWIAPLNEELHAAIAESLSARLGPANGDDASAADAAHWRIRIDVLRFDSAPAGDARLTADWTLRGGPRSVTCRSTIDEAAGESVAELVHAHQRAAARLADLIAAGLVKMASGEAAGCERPG